MTTPHPQPPAEPAVWAHHPDLGLIDLERRRWYEMTDLCRRLDLAQRLEPGYYRDPDWSVKDLVAHLGSWLAVAHVELERIGAGTYEPWNPDIDTINAETRDALRSQPWDLVWTQAHAARTWMLYDWLALPETSHASDFWIRKAGAEHYEDHLARLVEWVAELEAGRAPHG